MELNRSKLAGSGSDHIDYLTPARVEREICEKNAKDNWTFEGVVKAAKGNPTQSTKSMTFISHIYSTGTVKDIT